MELPPFVSIVQCPGRPVMSGMEKLEIQTEQCHKSYSQVDPRIQTESPNKLGHDMGGYKTYGGRKTYQRTRPPEKFGTPPKELVVCSVVDFCTGTKKSNDTRAGWKTYRTRGVQNPFLGGVSR